MMPLQIASPILCHCWRHDDIASARLILESICVNGLLLTTNATKLDGFQIDRGRGLEIMEIMQHPRTSFTDIPFDRMATHGKRYGNYGVGFKRETIIDWGGLPAWYLPNYWSDITLKIAGGVLVNSLHAAMHAADHLRAITEELAKQNIPVTVNYSHGPTVGPDQLVKEMEQVKNAVYTVLSFIKEMSPNNVENHSYLLEREWRLVSGMTRTDQTLPYRQLTCAEKEKLCTMKPAWRKPRESSDVNISSRYRTVPIIDSFQFFNGLPRRLTVAQSIDTILVPDEHEARWVEKFVVDHPRLFVESAPPRIIIFPGS
jgi:hypothetical protein